MSSAGNLLLKLRFDPASLSVVNNVGPIVVALLVTVQELRESCFESIVDGPGALRFNK